MVEKRLLLINTDDSHHRRVSIGIKNRTRISIAEHTLTSEKINDLLSLCGKYGIVLTEPKFYLGVIYLNNSNIPSYMELEHTPRVINALNKSEDLLKIPITQKELLFALELM